MLSDHLLDAALAAAKAWSHPAVEPRHLAYAIARRFRGHPQVTDEVLARAKARLDPPGTSTVVPEPDAAARALLDGIGTDDEALAVLAAQVEAGAPPGASPGETVADILAELDALVGLDAVKAQVRRVIAVVQANRTRAEAGLATVNPGLHLVFTGAPGTGKTTVARLVARLYAACGALPGSGFTEADRSDLVAGYVGQTAPKTLEVIERTRPGVLFIDEAYALAPSHASDFGAEAIATLVKAMEDHRDELAVIVAGYREQMADFVESNPGLRSRFKTFIDFPDYAPHELGRIFAAFAETAGLRLAPEVRDKAEDLFRNAVNRVDFGNARFARSLFEQAYSRMAERAAADGSVEVDELLEIVPADVEWTEANLQGERRRIGFGGAAAPAPPAALNPPAAPAPDPPGPPGPPDRRR